MTTPELIEYIQKALQAGIAVSAIKETLITKGGWDAADVELGLQQVQGQMAATMQTSVPADVSTSVTPDSSVVATPVTVNPVLATTAEPVVTNASDMSAATPVGVVAPVDPTISPVTAPASSVAPATSGNDSVAALIAQAKMIATSNMSATTTASPVVGATVTAPVDSTVAATPATPVMNTVTATPATAPVTDTASAGAMPSQSSFAAAVAQNQTGATTGPVMVQPHRTGLIIALAIIGLVIGAAIFAYTQGILTLSPLGFSLGTAPSSDITPEIPPDQIPEPVSGPIPANAPTQQTVVPDTTPSDSILMEMENIEQLDPLVVTEPESTAELPVPDSVPQAPSDDNTAQ